MTARQDFRDGNDPSKNDGAEKCFVESDSDYATDGHPERLKHLPSGDAFEYKVIDLEMGYFTAQLKEAAGRLLIIRGHAGLLATTDGALQAAFNILETEEARDGVLVVTSDALFGIGKFLNALAASRFGRNYTDPIVLIDNRPHDQR